jgi:hypothetical protein
VAKFIPGSGARGFSIQTLGNMPKTHRELFIGDDGGHIADNELNGYIKQFGTDRQKDMLGW